jgi:hypothetical protein
VLIKFTNGNEQHVSGEVGRGFITAGLATEVKKVIEPVVPEWSVILDESGFVAIKMELGSIGPGAIAAHTKGRTPVRGTKPTPQTVAFYQGDPDSIHDRRRWTPQGQTGELYCSAFGRPVPEDIVKQYRKARKNPKACAPAMPLKSIHHIGNDSMKSEMAFRNDPQKLFRPVVLEHEALAAEESSEGAKLPLIEIGPVPER